jgi:hypothetical protein
MRNAIADTTPRTALENRRIKLLVALPGLLGSRCERMVNDFPRHPHIVTTTPSRILRAVIAGWVVCQPGCARSPSPSAGQPPVAVVPRFLPRYAAAILAARLANDQCEQQYRRRPFAAGQHPAVLKDGVYRWGGLDVGGPGGFSALVTFWQDGSEPHVEVYFSSDALSPR